MTTIAELTTPMTVAEAQTAIYAALAARGARTTSWKAGAVVRTIVYVLAVITSGFSKLQAAIAKSGFLELSEGGWLTLTARYVYNEERDLGGFATGVMSFDNAGGGVYSGDPGDLVVSSSVNGKSYRNTEAFTIGALATGVEVAFQAVELGSASTAGAGEIDTMTTVLNGVTCSNAAAFVGTDEESDAALRARCRDKLGSLSPNGPADAYRYFATTAVDSDGNAIDVTRTATSATGNGTVTMYVANASGAISGTTGDPMTHLGAVNLRLEQKCVPLGVTLALASASAVTVAVTYELWVRDTIGLTNAEIETRVEAGINGFLQTLPIGGDVITPASGKVYVDSIKAAIVESLPTDTVVKLAVTLPAADTTLAVNEVAVPGTITPTAVHQITRSA